MTKTLTGKQVLALLAQQGEQQPVAFDYQTAADFLNGKTINGELVSRFVSAARWAHDDNRSLRSVIQSLRGELAARDAEIAMLKNALMEAEAAPAAQPDLSALVQQDQDESDMLTIAHLDGYERGKRDALAQQGEQQPVANDAARFKAQHQFLEWNRAQDEPLVKIAYEYGVFAKAIELYAGAAPAAQKSCGYECDCRGYCQRDAAAPAAQPDTWTDDGGWTFPVERQIIQTR